MKEVTIIGTDGLTLAPCVEVIVDLGPDGTPGGAVLGVALWFDEWRLGGGDELVRCLNAALVVEPVHLTEGLLNGLPFMAYMAQPQLSPLSST